MNSWGKGLKLILPYLRTWTCIVCCSYERGAHIVWTSYNCQLNKQPSREFYNTATVYWFLVID